MEKEDPYRVGVSVGSGIGGLGDMEEEHAKLLEKGPSKGKTFACANDDYKYGSRKCGYRLRS